MEVNLFVAFFSGLVSFFAPCVIPLLPAYIGYVTGVSLKDLKNKGFAQYRKQIFLSSLLYICGFSLVFVFLGTTAAGLGAAVRQYHEWIQIIGGIIIMIFALNLLGFFPFRFLAHEHRLKLPKWVDRLGYFRALFVGMVFATAWTPCVGAVLGAILTLAASSTTIAAGAVLLFVYSLGISIPFLIISLTLSKAPSVLKAIEQYLPRIATFFGILLFVIGFLLFNNNLVLISPWLTYNRLNGVLFNLASQLGLQEGIIPRLAL